MLSRPISSNSSHIFRSLASANLNSIIRECLQNHRLSEAREVFDRNPSPRDVVSWNMMIDGYVQSYQIHRARELFDQMPDRDIASWNTLLSGYYKMDDPVQVYCSFLEVRRVGLVPNEYTMSTVISAILNSEFNVLVSQLHACVLRLGLGANVFVGSALMKGYTNVMDQLAFRRLFDDLPVKDVSSWNALVAGYMELGCMEEAERAFAVMPVRNSISWTSLLNGYINNNRIDEARIMFDRMNHSERNVYSWTVMINGYVKSEKYNAALELFGAMVDSGYQPNHFTYSCVLNACALNSSLLMGQQVHSRVLKFGMPDSVILLTSLLDMYAKCGDINAAFCVFKHMRHKNNASWNSIIGGFARHGIGTRALEMFNCMLKDGIRPDAVTFVNVLYACGQGGLVTEGEEYFNNMKAKYGIEAELEHYACMVDLYGKAGQLEKAEKLIKEMPLEPDVVVWGAFLGACTMHSNLKIGEFAAEGIERLKKDHPAACSMFLKVHAERGSWSRVLELKRMMKQRCIRKQKAGSWVETSP